MNIIDEITAERTAQRGKPQSVSDYAWSLGEWAALISHYATRRCVGNLRNIQADELRADMVKVAALALACIESIDRKP